MSFSQKKLLASGPVTSTAYCQGSICKGVKGGYTHAVGKHIQKVNIKCLLNTLALIIVRSKNKCGHKQDLSLQHMGSKDTNLIEFFLNGSEIQ